MKTIRSAVQVKTTTEGVVSVTLTTSLDVWVRLQGMFSGSKLKAEVIDHLYPMVEHGHLVFIMPEHFKDENYLGVRHTPIGMSNITDINIWYNQVQQCEKWYKAMLNESDERTIRNSVLLGCTAIKVNIHGMPGDFTDLFPEVKQRSLKCIFSDLINN